MAKEAKTKPTDVPVADFVAAIEDPRRRADAETITALLAEASGEPAVMWGSSIIGYGAYRASTGAWPLIGFSPARKDITLYLIRSYAEADVDLNRLGKHKTGAGCLYIRTLADVDQAVLREMAEKSVAWMRETHPQPEKGPLHHDSHGLLPPVGEEWEAPAQILPRRGRGTA